MLLKIRRRSRNLDAILRPSHGNCNANDLVFRDNYLVTDKAFTGHPHLYVHLNCLGPTRSLPTLVKTFRILREKTS